DARVVGRLGRRGQNGQRQAGQDEKCPFHRFSFVDSLSHSISNVGGARPRGVPERTLQERERRATPSAGGSGEEAGTPGVGSIPALPAPPSPPRVPPAPPPARPGGCGPARVW